MPHSIHDVVQLVRYAPEDIEHAAFELAAVARRYGLTAMLPWCRDAVSGARAAVAIAARYEAQQGALHTGPKRLRARIPMKDRLTKDSVRAYVIVAREDLYLAFLHGLALARGRGDRAGRELADAMKRTNSTRLGRAAEENAALMATPPLPTGPAPAEDAVLQPQPDSPAAVRLRALRTWWSPVAEGPLAELGAPATWPPHLRLVGAPQRGSQREDVARPR